MKIFLQIVIAVILIILQMSDYNYDLFKFAFFFNLSLIFFEVLTLGIIKFYSKKRKEKEIKSLTLGLNSVKSIFIWATLVPIILHYLGVDLKTLFTSLSIFAAAIAITFKDYITSVISGIILMFSYNINVGDKVKINDNVGIVDDISLFRIHLKTEEGMIYVPNSLAFTIEIINYER